MAANLNLDLPGMNLLFCTTMLIVNSDEISTGTGFFYEGWSGASTAPLLITAKHLVENATSGSAFMVAMEDGKPKLGTTVSLDFTNDQWIHHPTADVSVMFVGRQMQSLLDSGTPPFFRTLGTDIFPSPEELELLDAVEPVTVVGYPASLIDGEHGTPLVRRGHTATPIHLAFDGAEEFLVDASATTGSSGSPVIVVHENGYREVNGYATGRTRVLFVGMLTGAITRKVLGTVAAPDGDELQVFFDEQVNLGRVSNWRTVDETVDLAFQSIGVSRPKT